MPELSEVEFSRTLLEKFLSGPEDAHHELNEMGNVNDTEIHEIQLMDDAIVLKNFNKDQAFSWKNAKVVAVKRWGKYFWIEARIKSQSTLHASEDCTTQYLVMHLGMTGCMRLKQLENDVNDSNQYVKLQSNIKYDPNEWPPRHTKLIIKRKRKLENESDVIDEIAFCDPRRLGRVTLISDIDPRNSDKGFLKNLGFDPIHNMPDSETFFSIISLRKTSKAPLKSLLLDQSFNAGIGNWMADEICYQAKLSPLQKIDELCLHPDQIENLRKAIEYVSTFAVSVQADSSRYPESWLFHLRWEKKKKRKKYQESDIGGKDQEKKRKVVFETIGGRTTAYIPCEQSIIRD